MEGHQQKALEYLVVDNTDLERLETLLDQYNVFESMGVVRSELRHSDFLSYLMNPSQNHGLGDTFVKRLLQTVLSNHPKQSSPITSIDLDTWDLNELIVMREWLNIDILLVDERNRLVVIIENKIDSGEHGEQLERYWQSTNQHYPNWHILGLFLTPDGDQPAHESYYPIDYLSICVLLEKLIETRSSTLGQDIHMAITHCSQMLRRHIVSESEIAELCKRIYRKHQQALDLIYEYRPDQQQAIRELLEQLVKDQPELISDHSSKSYIRFIHRDWDVPVLRQGEGWTSTKRILLFEFRNFENKLALHLIIGPGPHELRKKLFDVAQAHKPPFNPSMKSLANNWNAIYVRSLLAKMDYEADKFEDYEVVLKKKWINFLEHELPQLQSVFQAEKWLWK